MKRLFAIFAIAGLALSLPQKTLAFDPNFVLSDSDLENPYGLSKEQIQNYLNRGFLGGYKTEDSEGVKRTATEIIYRAAQKYDLNPKFFLVLIQKEQSLVEDPSPTQDQLDWAAGYAVCDNCSKSDPAIARWKGFGKQINSAGMQFRDGYLTDIALWGKTQGKYGPDVAIKIDGTTVIPENAATAALYAYTPHLHGNQNFSRIWDRWFSLEYPSGTLAQAAGSPDVYLLQYGEKRHIENWSAFITRFDPRLIIQVSPSTLDNYATGKPIGFPNYSLLEDEEENRYLLVDDTLRPIDSIETFRQIGFVDDQVVEISNADVRDYDLGSVITADSQYPQGLVLQVKGTSTVYYIQDGQRRLVLDPIIHAGRLHNAPPRLVEGVEIEQYTEGKPLTIPDGYLVKTADDPTVYVISEGLRRAIPSEGAFLSYGWSWDDIRVVSNSAIKLNKLGEPLSETAELNIAVE
jgi:hypothetical protein